MVRFHSLYRENLNAMTYLISMISLVCVLAITPQGTAFLQDETAVQNPTTAAPVEAWTPLQKEFRNLHRSLESMRGYTEEDKKIIRAFHEKVKTFRQQWPDDLRSMALDYTLSSWLDEQARADELIQRLVTLLPENLSLKVSYGDSLRMMGQYEKAYALFDTTDPTVLESRDAITLIVRCLFAENRFEEALQFAEIAKENTIESKMGRDALANLMPVLNEYVPFWEDELAKRVAEESEDTLPRVELNTNRGIIVVELFEDDAPNTVANFISLVEQEFYNGTKFHRVLPNQFAQGGDPHTKDEVIGRPGQGNPGYYIRDEIGEDGGRKHFAGTLSMAKQTDPNTGGCQFFLTHEPTHWLNGKHTVFGRILEGLDVARQLEKDDDLYSAYVLRKRPHEYIPQTLPLSGAQGPKVIPLDKPPFPIEDLPDLDAPRETPPE